MLPKNLQYMNKVESAPARQYTTTVQPENGTGNYGPNTKCRINIPTSPNTVLVPSESFLKFDIGGVTAGAAAVPYIRLDKCGAHGAIQRVRVVHGSTEIQDLDNYGAIVAEMMALQQTSDGFSGKQNVLAGTAPGQFVNGTTNEVLLTTAGERLNQTYATTAIGGVVPTRTYALNLMSYVGSMSAGKYIPLFEMTSAPLSLEVTFVSSALKFLCVAAGLAAGNNFTISNVEFVGTFIELSDEAIATIRASQGGQPLQYVIQNYSNINYSGTVASASSTSLTIPVAAKYASLKSLFCIPRRHADGALTFFPYSSTHFNINQWRVRIGSQLLPAKAPNTMVEHYSELLKAIGSLSDINHEPSINWYNYNAITPVANAETASAGDVTTRSMCFALGFDVETYANADKDRIFSGMDTRNSDIFWNIDFLATAIGADVNVRFDIYALYDQVILFENGMTRVVK